MANKSYLCYYDNRFFQGMMGLKGGGTFKNSGRNHSIVANLSLIPGQRTSRATTGRTNQSVSRLNAVQHQIYNFGEGVETETLYTALGGPRAEIVGVSPVVMTGMSPQYSLYGGTTTIGGVSCVYIDTTVELVGTAVATSIAIPIRIIRLA